MTPKTNKSKNWRKPKPQKNSKVEKQDVSMQIEKIMKTKKSLNSAANWILTNKYVTLFVLITVVCYFLSFFYSQKSIHNLTKVIPKLDDSISTEKDRIRLWDSDQILFMLEDNKAYNSKTTIDILQWLPVEPYNKPLLHKIDSVARAVNKEEDFFLQVQLRRYNTTINHFFDSQYNNIVATKINVPDSILRKSRSLLNSFEKETIIDSFLKYQINDLYKDISKYPKKVSTFDEKEKVITIKQDRCYNIMNWFIMNMIKTYDDTQKIKAKTAKWQILGDVFMNIAVLLSFIFTVITVMKKNIPLDS